MPKRKGAGAPPRSNPIARVKKLLPPNGDPISQIKLRKEVEKGKKGKGKGMSMKTLHKYLNKLVKNKQISKEWIEDPSRGRPIVHYRLLLDKFFPEGPKFYKDIVQNAGLAFALCLQRDKRQKTKDSEVFLEMTYFFMTVFMGRMLKEASDFKNPEAVGDYIKVVMETHLRPWLQQLAMVGQMTGGFPSKPLVSVFFPPIEDNEAWIEFPQVCERNRRDFDKVIENTKELREFLEEI